MYDIHLGVHFAGWADHDRGERGRFGRTLDLESKILSWLSERGNGKMSGFAGSDTGKKMAGPLFRRGKAKNQRIEAGSFGQ